MKKRLMTFILVVSMIFVITSCSKDSIKGLDGKEIVLPDKIETIVSAAASNTTILAALGVGEKIVATDTYSVGIEGVKTDVLKFDMMTPDMEQLLALNPDVLFASGINAVETDDPFKPLKDAGTCVIYVPTPTNIEEIKASINFIGDVVKKSAKAKEIVDNMNKEIDAIKTISAKIGTKKSVYIEISPAPSLYAVGSSSFINELVEIAGGINVLAEQKGYVSITDEAVISANPDVIFTTVGYTDDPVSEIKSRTGWENMTAIKNGNVYQLPENETSQPTQNVIIALKAMSEIFSK